VFDESGKKETGNTKKKPLEFFPWGTIIAVCFATVLVKGLFEIGIHWFAKPEEFQAKIIQIIDGNTIKVRKYDNTEIAIRFYGIDTPGPDQPLGAEVVEAMKESLIGRQVTVIEIGKNKNGNIEAIVNAKEGTVNWGMVAEGLAWYDPKYCSVKPACGKFRDAEKDAREEKRGLWALNNPVPPWEWRKRNQQGSNQ
jgi:endonuclease YncB( thermonuclease family)